MGFAKFERVWILALLPLVLACGRSAPDHVILIVVDTLRADHLGFYGHSSPTTPELDRWTSRGLVFDHAFATSPWTLPTFGSVLTGLWPAQHGAGSRMPEGGRRWRRRPLSPTVPTLPEVLREHGFTTGAIVNNAFLRPHFGAARGFDTYDYEKGRRAAAVIDLATDWLADPSRKRLFLMLHLIDPHLPYQAPAEFLGRFGPSSQDALELRGRKKIVDRLEDLTAADREALRARYDEEIASLDHELGRFFTYLVDAGMWDRTLVVLTSDHGEELFDHGGFEHGHSMFQEVLRVPLVVWGPGVAAGRNRTPVSVVDLKPTILDAVGVAFGDGLAGESLWGMALGKSRSPRREMLAQNILWGRELASLVAWPYKLILDPKHDRVQLYDLSADPAEQQDLATQRPEVAVELRRRLEDRLAVLETPSHEPDEDISSETEDELRALGYLD
jgi:arylsulfatase A-like enzyme